jgi:hypothetical protein
MKHLLVLILVAASVAGAQQSYRPPSSCPVLATLASSKFAYGDDPGCRRLQWCSPEGESIVIWYFNRGSKTIHGAEFHLVMLDAAGNRYPAFQAYQAEGTVKHDNGDFVIYPATEEAKYFGDKWTHIHGVEVYVARLLFTDATVWTPAKGVFCKTSFLNDAYDKEIERRQKAQQQQNAKAKKK